MSQGYIIIYAKQDDNASAANPRAERAKMYLANEQVIEAGRIVTIDGSTRKERMVELYIVPAGAIPPKPKPNVSDYQD